MPHISRVAAAAYDLLPRRGQEASQGTTPAAPPASRGVPVVAAAAKQGNLGIYLTWTGLGQRPSIWSPSAPGSVGTWSKWRSRKGNSSAKGILLAEIDPRPFQVQLAQAEGQMAKDQAQLKNAQRDLERFKILLEPRPDLQTGI